MIVDSDINNALVKNQFALVPKYVSKDATTECKLSIGRIFHRITLCGSEIRITRYRPRYVFDDYIKLKRHRKIFRINRYRLYVRRFPYPPFKIPYRYRFQAPDHLTYGVSEASFEAEKLENFNWNYLDHYICTRGDSDFALIEVRFHYLYEYRTIVLHPVNEFICSQ